LLDSSNGAKQLSLSSEKTQPHRTKMFSEIIYTHIRLKYFKIRQKNKTERRKDIQIKSLFDIDIFPSLFARFLFHFSRLALLVENRSGEVSSPELGR
jgi:hypothetical protein